MTQYHYLASVQDNVREDLDPQFCSLLRNHWLEEAQHTTLDTLMVEQLASELDATELQASIDDFFRILELLEGGLRQQVGLDIESLGRATGRTFSEAERQGRLGKDTHPDEHATCYIVRGRGLVVISSCGHTGIINTVRSAMAAANVATRCMPCWAAFTSDRRRSKRNERASSCRHAWAGCTVVKLGTTSPVLGSHQDHRANDVRATAFERHSPDIAGVAGFALKQSFLADRGGLLWSAWAAQDEIGPANVDYNNALSFTDAGSNFGGADCPVKAIEAVDSTWRMPFGFSPTGSEAGMCIIPGRARNCMAHPIMMSLATERWGRPTKAPQRSSTTWRRATYDF